MAFQKNRDRPQLLTIHLPPCALVHTRPKDVTQFHEKTQTLRLKWYRDITKKLLLFIRLDADSGLPIQAIARNAEKPACVLYGSFPPVPTVTVS
jgi:hypothetical protein